MKKRLFILLQFLVFVTLLQSQNYFLFENVTGFVWVEWSQEQKEVFIAGVQSGINNFFMEFVGELVALEKDGKISRTDMLLSLEQLNVVKLKRIGDGKTITEIVQEIDDYYAYSKEALEHPIVIVLFTRGDVIK